MKSMVNSTVSFLQNIVEANPAKVRRMVRLPRVLSMELRWLA
jgi:hypothetical protein